MVDVDFARYSAERRRAHIELKKSEYLTTLCNVCRLVDFEYLLFGALDTGFRHSPVTSVYLGRLSDVRNRAQSTACSFCQHGVLSSAEDILDRNRVVVSDDLWEPEGELHVILWAMDPNRLDLLDDDGYCAVHVGLQNIAWLDAVASAGVPGHVSHEELKDWYPRSSKPLRLLNHPRLSRSLSLEDRAKLGRCKEWFESCQSTHMKCGHESQFDTDSNSEANKDFKLIDLSSRCIVELGKASGIQYATLSYVCGRSDTLWKLPKASEHWNRNKTGLRIHPLPKTVPRTISEAMTVTGSLGLQYLWVDSFCITQDDPVELQTQIQRMYYIYTCASICIIAGPGTDSHSGIPGISQARTVDPSCTLTLKKGLTLGFSPSTLSELLQRYKWMKRAWTYQELILSKCCLIFTEQQAFFYCASMTCSESYVGPHVDREAWRGGSSDSYLIGNANVIRSTGPATDPSDMYRRYAAAIREYSCRELSYQTDGLNAFYGLSTLMGQLMDTEMIFGCPKKTLVNCLTWRRNETTADVTDRPRRRMKAEPEEVGDEKHLQPLFPSWAWVGWNCGNRDLRLRGFEYYFWGSEMLILDTGLVPPIQAPHTMSREFVTSDHGAEGSWSTLQGILPVLTKVATFRIVLDEDLPGYLELQTSNGDHAGEIDIRGSQDNLNTQNPYGLLIQFWIVQNDGKPSSAEVMLVKPSPLPSTEGSPGEEHLQKSLRAKHALKTPKPLTAHRMRMKDAKFMSRMSGDCLPEVRIPSTAYDPDQVPEVILASRIGVGFVKYSAWVEAKPKDAIVLLG